MKDGLEVRTYICPICEEIESDFDPPVTILILGERLCDDCKKKLRELLKINL